MNVAVHLVPTEGRDSGHVYFIDTALIPKGHSLLNAIEAELKEEDSSESIDGWDLFGAPEDQDEDEEDQDEDDNTIRNIIDAFEVELPCCVQSCVKIWTE